MFDELIFEEIYLVQCNPKNYIVNHYLLFLGGAEGEIPSVYSPLEIRAFFSLILENFIPNHFSSQFI